MTTVVTPDGRTLAITSSDDRTVRVWDLNTGDQIGQPLSGHGRRVVTVTTVVTPDGRTLAITSSWDGT
ncbi:WD40 repeat domain-containing protein, partial [Pseudonocardia sp. D17]|uniref:WD40 repeat domain-containing protein n=1 Tax=Pseudonocardia sp. D17 TaxID=882661 RepID=UPI0030CC94D0